jgi:type IV pilus assembly protein PilV
MRYSAQCRVRPGCRHEWRRHQRGVGLIEVMVAVLVLSIGFLGVGALLATSLSTNNSAAARSMATMHTYSILDAMRMDKANAAAGAYNKSEIPGSCKAPSGTLASQQLHDWCTQLGDLSPDPSKTKGTVACTQITTTDVQCTVTIVFDDSRAGKGGSSSQTVVTKAML